jgi:uncharacterized membrane protein
MTANNVITVSFKQDNSAYQALSRLKELDDQGQISLAGAAIVERGQDGQLTVKDQVQDPHIEGAATGGLLGLLVGILGGPFGILIGGATGLMVGSLFDLDDVVDEGSALATISTSIRPGDTVLLAAASEPSSAVIDSAMDALGGSVVRRSIVDVEAEIAAAEEAQRAAKREARAKLRADHRRQLGDEIHAKVDAMAAKL